MLAQADDLAGEAVAVNMPGTDRERPNWRRRIAMNIEDILETELAEKILAAMAGRAALRSDAVESATSSIHRERERRNVNAVRPAIPLVLRDAPCGRSSA